MIWQALTRYLSMIKFSHSIFALPLAGIAFVQALPHSQQRFSSIAILAIQVLVCMVSLRSCAMGFNRLVDRNYDALNPRTRNREIPSGTLSSQYVRLFVILCALIFILTAWSIHTGTGLLALPALLLVCGYSYSKRFSCLSHFILGLAIGLAPLAAWIAVLGRVDILPIDWSLGLAFYIAGFDILYSCQDYEFDRKHGLHSLPARFGIPTALWTARFSHLLALLFFSLAGLESNSHIFFWVAIGLTALLFGGEHFLVYPKAKTEQIAFEKIPIAFFHINAAVSTVLFLGVTLDFYFRNSLLGTAV